MTQGQLVYVRDPFHNHYGKWGKASFVKELDREYGEHGYMVEFLWSKNGQPMGVCGLFPECKDTLSVGDEVIERVYA
jgi:hypothetical protein